MGLLTVKLAQKLSVSHHPFCLPCCCEATGAEWPKKWLLCHFCSIRIYMKYGHRQFVALSLRRARSKSKSSVTFHRKSSRKLQVWGRQCFSTFALTLDLLYTSVSPAKRLVWGSRRNLNSFREADLQAEGWTSEPRGEMKQVEVLVIVGSFSVDGEKEHAYSTYISSK